MSILCIRAYQLGPGRAPEVHRASTWGLRKDAELHINIEGINNKCMLNVSS